ncbi:hypothetical protein ACFFX0_16230 [Citricoccus parietis]|uniref:Uncharacterized protein n=1 Tax=Citricoccus parietis TaxID=592307 RepID=A0ABV5G152_9MICC
MQQPRQFFEGQGCVLPECKHHQILRVSQLQRFEHGPVGGDHASGRHGQRKTDLAFQGQGIRDGKRFVHTSRMPDVSGCGLPVPV